MTTTTAAAGKLPAIILIILGVLNAVGPLTVDTYLPGMPGLAAELGAGRAEAQLSLTACLVGIAVGQLIAGPWSDTVGRRLPLVLGAVGYTLASLACAAAPDLTMLIVLRFVQGLAGAVGVVAGRAVVRDVASGPLAVRYYSQLATAGALAPVAAPLLGSAILMVASWRGVFIALAVLGMLLTVLLLVFFRETHPLRLRSSAAPSATLGAFSAMLRDRRFVGYLGVGAFSGVMLFAYISGSSFLFQGEFGATAEQFALAFSLNGLGIAVFSQLNARLAPRFGTGRMMRVALAVQSTAAAALIVLAFALPREPSAIPVLGVVLFGIVAPVGMVTPNFIARGMGRAGTNAGAASALLGATTFLVGGLVSPLTGFGDVVGVMAALVVLGAVGCSVLVIILTRHDGKGSPERTSPEGAGA